MEAVLTKWSDFDKDKILFYCNEIKKHKVKLSIIYFL